MKTDKEWIRFLLRGPVDQTMKAVREMPIEQYNRLSKKMEESFTRLIDDVGAGDTN